MPRVTWHVERRQRERAIPPEHIAAALAGRCIDKGAAGQAWYDPRSRCCVHISADGVAATTVYRLQKKQLKARYSR
jgi:hypothetical protein